MNHLKTLTICILFIVFSCNNNNEKAFVIQSKSLHALLEKRKNDVEMTLADIEMGKFWAEHENRLESYLPIYNKAVSLRELSYEIFEYIKDVKNDFVSKTETLQIDKEIDQNELVQLSTHLMSINVTNEYFTDSKIDSIEAKLQKFKKDLIDLNVVNQAEIINYTRLYYNESILKHKRGDLLPVKDMPMIAAINELTTWQIKIKDIQFSLFNRIKAMDIDMLIEYAESKHKVEKKETPFSANVTQNNDRFMYRGVDNPITIEVKNGKESQVNASCEGCNNLIHKGKGNYVVRPGISDNLTITLNSKNADATITQLGKFTYKVKTVPNPTIQFAKKLPGETISKNDISGNMPIIPFFIAFDYPVYASIERYSITYTNEIEKNLSKTFNGNKISKEVASDIKKSPSGSKLIFENVECVMPDETIRKLQAIYTIK